MNDYNIFIYGIVRLDKVIFFAKATAGDGVGASRDSGVWLSKYILDILYSKSFVLAR